MRARLAVVVTLQLLWVAAPFAVLAGVRPCDFFANSGEFPEGAGRSGILLWSWGRCGTGTLWDTLRDTLAASHGDLRAVCGRKEGLPGSCLAATFVDSCLSHIPTNATFFTHLKPKYIYGSEWKTVPEIMSAFHSRGAKVLVVVKRDNWLARDVSGMEDKITKSIVHHGRDPRESCDHSIFRESPCPGNCANTFQGYQDMVDQGIKAGKKAGLRVVTVTFKKDDTFPCKPIRKILEAAVETGVISSMPSPDCVPHITHASSTSHVGGATLESKVGQCVAKAINSELRGTDYEWMLDLSRQQKNGGEAL